MFPAEYRTQPVNSIAHSYGPATLVDLFHRVECVLDYGSYCQEVLTTCGPTPTEPELPILTLAGAVDCINLLTFRAELATLVANAGLGTG